MAQYAMSSGLVVAIKPTDWMTDCLAGKRAIFAQLCTAIDPYMYCVYAPLNTVTKSIAHSVSTPVYVCVLGAWSQYKSYQAQSGS